MKKILSFLILFVFVGAITAVPTKQAGAAVVKDIKVIQDIGIPEDSFIGAISLSEANLYEDDFNSKYLFPMQGMCITDDGKIAVLDASYGRVHVLNVLLENTYNFGSNKELIYPTDIDYSNESYFISDALGQNIKVYLKSGQYSKTISNGMITSPVGVAVLNNYIFVADYFGNQVLKLDSNGTVLKTFNVASPGGLSTNHKDTVVSISMNENKCYLFDVNLKLISSFSLSALTFPSDSALDSAGNIYIVDRGLSQGNDAKGLVAMYTKDGTLVKFIGASTNTYPNQTEGSLLTPCGIAVDTSNNIYVFDGGFYYWSNSSDAPFGFPLGARISVFSKQGYFLSKKDFLHSSVKGILVNPLSVTLDENGNIWVLNYGGFETSKLTEFSQNGTFVKDIEKAGIEYIGEAYAVYSDKKGNIYVGLQGGIAIFTSSGAFKRIARNETFGEVRKIISGKDGYLYATSYSKNEVIKFDSNLKIIAVYQVCKFPAGIAQDASGNFYVTSIFDNKVHVYSLGFQEVLTIGKGGGRGRDQFYVPEDVAIDKYGNAIVLDTENGRISVWSKEGALMYQSQRIFYELSSIESENGTLLVTDCFHNIVRILQEDFESTDYAFYTSIYPETLTLGPSDSESVVLTIQNLGTKTDVFTASFESTLPAGNLVIKENPPFSYTLKSNETKKLVIDISVPATAKDGDSYEIRIKATSQTTGLAEMVNTVIKVSTNLPQTLFAENTLSQEGQTFSMPVYIKNAKGVRGVSFDLIFDSQKVSLVSVDPTEITKDNLIVFSGTSQGATVAIVTQGENIINGKVQIAGLKFKGNSVSTNVISFQNARVFNVIEEIVAIESKPSVVIVGPKLTVNFADNIVSQKQNFTFTGITNPSAKVFVNGREVSVSSSGSFTSTVVLSSSENTIIVNAKAASGEETTITRTVLYKGSLTVTIMMKIGSPIMSVNGIEQEIDLGRGTTPIIIPGWNRTIVPIRAIVESIGGVIDWDGTTRLVTITLKGKTVKLWVDNPIAEVNGTKVQIDPDNQYVKPVIINSRTFVPVRFVAENLGCTVQWDDKTRTVTITYSG